MDNRLAHLFGGEAPAPGPPPFPEGGQLGAVDLGPSMGEKFQLMLGAAVQDRRVADLSGLGFAGWQVACRVSPGPAGDDEIDRPLSDYFIEFHMWPPDYACDAGFPVPEVGTSMRAPLVLCASMGGPHHRHTLYWRNDVSDRAANPVYMGVVVTVLAAGMQGWWEIMNLVEADPGPVAIFRAECDPEDMP